jgi:hypothetical protein
MGSVINSNQWKVISTNIARGIGANTAIIKMTKVHVRIL